jgi:hypothetical protein
VNATGIGLGPDHEREIAFWRSVSVGVPVGMRPLVAVSVLLTEWPATRAVVHTVGSIHNELYLATMQLSFCPLEGRFVRLEPFSPQLKEQVRLAIDCDPGTWAIMPINPMGERFEEYWNIACGAPTTERMV